MSTGTGPSSHDEARAMDDSTADSGDPTQPEPIGRPRWLLATALYSAAIVGATWPYVKTVGSKLPSLGDTLQHIWIMRWYRTALAEGRSPLRCMDLQYPFGAPLANFSPLHLQSVLFLALSWLVNNDVLMFNILWFVGFLTTGLGTYALARWAIRNERAALMAGLLAMISGPMMVHSHAHLELMFVGGFPLFMMAWIRFVDDPSASRLGWAAGALVLVAMSAAYYLVFATVAAGVYVAYALCLRPSGERARWLLNRSLWMSGFATACVPLLALLFTAQLSELAAGHNMTRPRSEFDGYRTPWWSYLAPAPGTRLFSFLGSTSSPFHGSGLNGEGMAYLGVVCMVLMVLSLLGRKSTLARARFWWLLLGALVLLSMGSYLTIGSTKLELPASWLWEVYPPFKLIRVPARFKFFAAVVAAVIAGAGLARLERFVRPSWARWAVFAGLAVLAVVDLGHTPYTAESLPEMPKGYSWLMSHDARAAWVDVPQFSTGDGTHANACWTYWQSIHRGKTTAGYSGHAQWALDNLMTWNSPFTPERLADPQFLKRPQGDLLDILTETDGLSYIWVYLTYHEIPYVVVNRWVDQKDELHGYANLREILAPALVYEDDKQSIFARDLLPTPSKAVVMSGEGWLTRCFTDADGYFRPVGESSELIVYNPDPSRPVVVGMRARGLGADRQIKVLHEGREIFAFSIPRNQPSLVSTPPLTLPSGFQRLELRTDGSVGAGHGGHKMELVPERVSLLISGLNLVQEPGELAAKPGGGISR